MSKTIKLSTFDREKVEAFVRAKLKALRTKRTRLNVQRTQLAEQVQEIDAEIRAYTDVLDNGLGPDVFEHGAGI